MNPINKRIAPPIHRRRKTSQLKARCDGELRAHFDTLAQLRGLDTSDLVRMACIEFANKHSFGL